MTVDAPDLGRMVGPLPVGGWVAAVGLGLGAAYLVNRRNGPGLATADTAAGPAADILDPTSYAGANYGGTPLAPQTDTGTAAGYIGNDEWAAAAVKALVQNNVAAGYTAGQVIRKVLEGAALTPAEQQIVNRAYSLVGPPPQGVPVAQPSIPGQNPRPTAPNPTGVAQGALGRYTRAGAVGGWHPETWAQIATRLTAAGYRATAGRGITVSWLTSRTANMATARKFPVSLPAGQVVYF